MVVQVEVPHSVVEGKEPLPSEVAIGGLAVNLPDRAIYSKGYDNVVFRLNGAVIVEDDGATAAAVFPTWVREVGGNVKQYTTSTKLSFNPSTGQLTSVSFAGDGSGLTGFTADQITDALGYAPVDPVGAALGPAATDLATVIALANNMRAALISCGIGS